MSGSGTMAKCSNNNNIHNVLVFFVNGKMIQDRHVDPEWTLLYYLRNKLRLSGTKSGCGEGGCGACTVMVSKYDRLKDKIIHLPVNACLAPVCSMHGLAITTIEGVGSTKTKLHPVQERIAKAHGSQCGFCTPGMVMSMYTLIRNSPKPTMKELEVAFQGNLCRCTGYRAIIEGYRTFTEEWEQIQNAKKLVNGVNGVCGMGDQCCRIQNGTVSKNNIKGINGIKKHYNERVNTTNRINGSVTNCNDGNNYINEIMTNGTDCDVKIKYANESNGLDDINKSNNEANHESLFQPSEFIPYDPSQEVIFPPALKLTDKYDKQYLVIKGPNVTWYRPTSLTELLNLKSMHPNAKIVVGNTEVGVEVKFKHVIYPVIICPIQIPELVKIIKTQTGVKIGAAATLTSVDIFLRDQIKKQPEHKTRIFVAMVEMLHWFAGKQIRSVGALGSNIMTGSPISDMIPVLMAAKAELELHSKRSGVRKVLLDNNFFIGYRKSIVKPNEILLSIHVPFSKPDQYFQAYKQARRREDDITIVNTAVNVTFEPKSHIISNISFGFGGMSFKTVAAPKTEKKLKGMPWNRETLEVAYSYLLEELPLDPGAPGGMIQYRRSLTLGLFFRAFLAISQRLQKYLPYIKLDEREVSGINGFQSKEFKSSQYFTVVPETQEKITAVHRPLVHVSAYKQATGEATYCDDIPHQEGELYCAFVLSTKTHANILKIDESEAVAVKGVHGFVSGRDMNEKRNIWGVSVPDEKVFYSDKVTAQGQIIGAIVADNQIIAQKAARLVKIEYQDLEPVIITIEDAIKHKSYFADPHRTIQKGDIDKVLKEAPHIIEGECRIGGQKHFYLETQSCIVIPKPEDGEMEIYSATQNPSKVSKVVAEVLGIQQNKVVTKVKRVGGGFGGKESKSVRIAVAVAVAAKKFNRPLRCVLERDDDIITSGGRHPFLMKYKIAFDGNGKILGCDAKMYSNCGYAHDMSLMGLDRAMTHFENAYMIPTVRVVGYPCKTNMPSNTACRGFGGPQGMYIAECMAQHIADYLNKDPEEISELNLYKEGDVTHYNQKLINCNLDKCWKQCIDSSNYYIRRKEVNKFNRENKYRKRGLSIIPTKFGIAFPITYLNQGGALVLVYTDGSVLLSHGGIEMGQGLYTKMLQVASSALEIPIEKIYTCETSTDKIPNTSATAASSGSDLNGQAIMEACKIIRERLKPYREKNPNGTWDDWVKKAYFDRVSLAATGFCRMPNIGHNWETGEGNMFNYHTMGVGCSEVEIDTLTGDHQVLRTDIVMDVGESLNPAIDIGQIEGGFVVGYGLFVLEEMVYSPKGETITRGPGTYKTPGFGDIPAEFNVSLLKGVSNPRAVYSSKAIGEPPFFLASSVLFAIKDAIKAAREENGIKKAYFRFDAPATSPKIRMACQDHITSKLTEPEPGSFIPWNIEV